MWFVLWKSLGKSDSATSAQKSAKNNEEGYHNILVRNSL